MIKHPKLKNHLYAEIIGSERTLLIAEGRCFALHGRVVARVVPLINEGRTTDEIVDQLQSQFSQTEIYHAVLSLEKAGHIEEDSAALPGPIAAFWNTMGVDTRKAAHLLESRTVWVKAFGDASAEALTRELERLSVRTRDGKDADLWVAVTDDYLQDGLEEFNRGALRQHKPWLIARPNGIYSWVGPIFQPGATGCWACMAQRLRGNFETEEFARTFKGQTSPYPPRAFLPTTLDIGLGMTATAVAKWIVLGPNSPLSGTVITFDSVTFQTQEHTLIRRPQCPDCGGADLRTPEAKPVAVGSVKKTFVEDGGHRAASPEETLRKFKHHVSPITGIAKTIVRASDESQPLVNVYVTGSNMAVRHNSFERLRRNIRSSCCGKGITDAQARVSALCEALERYSGVFRGEEPRITSTARALGDRAIDPRDYMLFSKDQYRDRDRWNAQDRRLDMIPLPFDVDLEMEWSPLWSLTRQDFRYMPTSLCYYSYPATPEEFYCLPESNGCAGGNTHEEAMLQGFMELVERDAVAVWWYNRLRRPAVDLDSFNDPFIQNLRAHYRDLSRDLWVLDLTHDLGIPAFIAISRRVDRAIEDIIFAPAAHFEARLGIVRALTELNQMLPGVSTSKPDGTGYGYDDPEAIHWWRNATLENQPYLNPSGETPKRREDYSPVRNDDLLDDILHCRSIVEGLGLEMLVLDQTRPDIGLPVVKVVVPGLRHFWPRYAPGRLYDVPVKMGWLSRPLQEQELNPIGVFI